MVSDSGVVYNDWVRGNSCSDIIVRINIVVCDEKIRCVGWGVRVSIIVGWLFKDEDQVCDIVLILSININVTIFLIYWLIDWANNRIYIIQIRGYKIIPSIYIDIQLNTNNISIK